MPCPYPRSVTHSTENCYIMLQSAKSPGPVWMPQLELSLGICLGEGLGSIPFWQLYSTKLGIDPDLLFNTIFKDI